MKKNFYEVCKTWKTTTMFLLLTCLSLGHVSASNYLTFTAVESDATFSFHNGYNIKGLSIQYSTDGSIWDNLVFDQTYTIAEGTSYYFKGENDAICQRSLSHDVSNCFVIPSGKIKASGSVMSLLDGDGTSTTISQEYCFWGLFRSCANLIQAPELPATTLTSACYAIMFWGCTSLVTAPELPATTLADNCYINMFQDCTSLVNAPELPATTLAPFCYAAMFQGCTSLTKAPELPATEWGDTYNCYQYMFYNCSNLNYISVNFDSWGEEYDEEEIEYEAQTGGWLINVAPTGTFVKKADLEEKRSGHFIPTGWDVLTLLDLDEETGMPADVQVSETTPMLVRLKRNLRGGMYNTLCLPFAIPSLEGTPLEGASVVEYVSSEIVDNVLKVYFNTATSIQAGVPYLIMPEEDITEPMTFSNVLISTLTPQTVSTEAMDFIGIFNPFNMPNDGQSMNLGENNTLYYSNGDGTSMKGFRAYFAPHTNGAPIPARLYINARGIVTEIEESAIDAINDGLYMQDGTIRVLHHGKKYSLIGNLIK